MTMKKIQIVIVLIFSAAFVFWACNGTKEETLSTAEFNVPSSVTLASDAATMDFKVLFNHPPKTSDQIVFEDSQGNAFTCAITFADDNKFTVRLPPNLMSGTYKVYLLSGGTKTLKGNMSVSIIYATTPGDTVTPEGASIYGLVTCEGKPLSDVVMSDGVEVVKTDENGVYRIASQKKFGYVFISVPSGYEPPLNGVLPQNWKPLTRGSLTSERVDFTLNKIDNNIFTLYVMGDMHLAKKQNDINQFRDFASSLMDDVNSGAGRQYGLTLGDMTWDYYWYRNSYSFAEYKAELNRDLSMICVWQTMGNHDNNYREAGDFLMENAYREAICPTYYSYNLGSVHFVVLDDIDYKNTPASVDDASGNITKDYRSQYLVDFTKNQIDWLKKDLSFVDKKTPVVISSHAPAYRPNGATGYKDGLTSHSDGSGDYGTAAFRALLSGYNVHFFSAHTHNHFTYDDSANGFYETNGASVCGTWWWSGYYTPGFNLSPDGTPGGYTICKFNGTDVTWQYKSAGADHSYQFRSYDMNEVQKVLTDEIGGNKDDWKKMVDWTGSLSANSVLINVWAYDKNWKVTVTEGGKELATTAICAYDPLHMLVNSAPRFKSGSTSFVTAYWPHFFVVNTTSANSTLEIKVTDRFGNAYSETMARPKIFTKDAYKYMK